MVFQNDYINRNIREQQVKQYIQEVETDRLVASLKPHRPNAIAQFVRNILHGTGHVLVTTGRRLEDLNEAQRVQIGNATASK